MPPSLTDDEYRLFREWLVQEYGLDFGPEKREILRARLEPRRAALNLPTFERLLFHVRFHPSRDQERLRLVSQLTNNESYFFRERRHFGVLTEDLLPGLVADARAAGRQEIRVLSAGSAAGEEAYTLVALLQEALRGTGMQPEVTGVDVDAAALERARAGVYRAHALRGLEEAARRRLFREAAPGRWRLQEGIRSAARFEQGNLMDPDWGRRMAPQDVVFCRNVMIYFDPTAVGRAAENLYRVMRPGGVLFLGHAETLRRTPTRFVVRRRPGTVYYERPKE